MPILKLDYKDPIVKKFKKLYEFLVNERDYF